jgi:hypothetical protein
VVFIHLRAPLFLANSGRSAGFLPTQRGIDREEAARVAATVEEKIDRAREALLERIAPVLPPSGEPVAGDDGIRSDLPLS